LTYINILLQYHNISDNPDELSDSDWALKYATLEDIRKKEKERTLNELGRFLLSDKD
jgi:hypothetical protein